MFIIYCYVELHKNFMENPEPSQEIKAERERIKGNVRKAIKREIDLNRLKHYSRLLALQEYLIFLIDNPKLSPDTALQKP